MGRFACVSIYYETRHKNFIFYELNVTVFEEAMLWLAQFGGQRHVETVVLMSRADK